MLRVRDIHSDTVRTVSVVESLETWHSRTPARCQVIGKIEPLAVIVRGPDGQHAFDINAEPIDAEDLARMLASPDLVAKR